MKTSINFYAHICGLLHGIKFRIDKEGVPVYLNWLNEVTFPKSVYNFPVVHELNAFS